MGYGAYSSDFDGCGGTFCVNGPLGMDDDDYEDYKKENTNEDGECLSQAEADQEVYNSFNGELIRTIEETGRALDLSVAPRAEWQYLPTDSGWKFPHDDEFVSVINDVVHAGWRSWQHDFVVGAAGPEEGNDAMAMALARGMSIGAYNDLRAAMGEKLLTCIRLRMMRDGFECTYKTSSYTSSVYKTPEAEDADVLIEHADADFKKSLARFNVKSPMEGLTLLSESAEDTAEKKAILKTIEDCVADILGYTYGGKKAFSDELAVYVPLPISAAIGKPGFPHETLQEAADAGEVECLWVNPFNGVALDISSFDDARLLANAWKLSTAEFFALREGKPIDVVIQEASFLDADVELTLSSDLPLILAHEESTGPSL